MRPTDRRSPRRRAAERGRAARPPRTSRAPRPHVEAMIAFAGVRGGRGSHPRPVGRAGAAEGPVRSARRRGDGDRGGRGFDAAAATGGWSADGPGPERAKVGRRRRRSPPGVASGRPMRCRSSRRSRCAKVATRPSIAAEGTGLVRRGGDVRRDAGPTRCDVTAGVGVAGEATAGDLGFDGDRGRAGDRDRDARPGSPRGSRLPPRSWCRPPPGWERGPATTGESGAIGEREAGAAGTKAAGHRGRGIVSQSPRGSRLPSRSWCRSPPGWAREQRRPGNRGRSARGKRRDGDEGGRRRRGVAGRGRSDGCPRSRDRSPAGWVPTSESPS